MKRLIALLVLSLVSGLSYSQAVRVKGTPAKKDVTLLANDSIEKINRSKKGVAFSQLYLSGKWVASCPIEIEDNASMIHCPICPTVIDKKDGHSRANIKDVELTFQDDSITLNQNGKITTVPYTRNKDTHAFSFTLDGKEYNFRLFISDKQRVIEDSDGLVVVLNRPEEEKK